MNSGKEAISVIVNRYPQLHLDIGVGKSKSEEYKDIALKGLPTAKEGHKFSMHEGTSISQIETNAGIAEVLYLPERNDFVRFVQIMAYRCEPKEVPNSMGAITIRNINNWRKIHKHKIAYLLLGNTDWKEEFIRFTTVKENYRDTIIAITDGQYSALPFDDTPFCQKEWLDISLKLREYHELAHFVSGRLFQNNRDVLRDEVIADCIGLLASTRSYNVHLAKKLLGIEQKDYREGGRLENYVTTQKELHQCIMRANEIIDGLQILTNDYSKLEPLIFLEMLEKKRIFILKQ